MLTASQRDKIADPSLLNYLTRIAHNIVHMHYPEQLADDLLQEMHLYILERTQKDPTFLDQKPGYVSKAAAWHARTWCRDQHADWFRTLEPGAGDWDTCDDPDVGLSIDVRDALSGLGDKAIEVARLLAAGYKGADLEARSGMSKQLISHYRRQLRQALAFAVA
jgi:hypothetical protein